MKTTPTRSTELFLHHKTSLWLLICTAVLALAPAALATPYYSSGNHPPTDVNYWWTGTGGSGSHPANFTTAGDTFEVQGTSTYTATADWTVTGNVTIDEGGKLAMAAKNLSVGGDTTINGTLDGSGTNGDTWTFSGDLTVGSAGVMNYSGGTSVYPVTLTFNGITTWSYSGSTYPLTGASAPKFNWSVTGTLTLNSQVSITNARNFTIASPGILHCGTQIISGAGTFIFTSGTLDVGDAGGLGTGEGRGTPSTTGNIRTAYVTPNFKLPAAANYIFSGTGAQDAGGFLPSPVTGNITIQNNGSFTTPTAGGFVINTAGTLAVNSPAVLALTSSQAVTGTGKLNGTGTIQVTKTGSTSTDDGTQYAPTTKTLSSLTVEFIGASAQKTTTTAFGGLKVNNSSGLTLGANASIAGTLTLTSGQLNLNEKTLTLASGDTVSVDTGSLSAAPTLSGTVNVTYTGTAAVNTGYEIPSSTSALSNLAINKTGGVTMSANATVNGTLTVNSGANLDFNGHTVTVATAPVLNGALTMEVTKNGANVFTGSKLTQSAGTLAYGGTLTVTASGQALAGGDVIDLFDAGGFSGSFGAPTLPTPLPTETPALNWYTGNLALDGTIIVNRAPQAQDILLGAQSGVKQILQIINSPKYAPTDLDGNTLTLSQVSYTSGHGATVNINGNSVEYTAPSTFTGPDSFAYTVSDGRGGTATATVAVTVSAAVNQQTASISFNGSSVSVVFWGIPGVQYTIQRSTDLSNWADIGTATANDTSHQPYGQINFTDSSPPNTGSGFYRLKP